MDIPKSCQCVGLRHSNARLCVICTILESKKDTNLNSAIARTKAYAFNEGLMEAVEVVRAFNSIRRRN